MVGIYFLFTSFFLLVVQALGATIVSTYFCINVIKDKKNEVLEKQYGGAGQGAHFGDRSSEHDRRPHGYPMGYQQLSGVRMRPDRFQTRR